MQDTPRETLTVETLAGILACRRDGEWRFSVEMGRPRFGWQDIPLREAVPDTPRIPFPIGPATRRCSPPRVNMGNPHAVFFVDDLDAYRSRGARPRART